MIHSASLTDPTLAAYPPHLTAFHNHMAASSPNLTDTNGGLMNGHHPHHPHHLAHSHHPHHLHHPHHPRSTTVNGHSTVAAASSVGPASATAPVTVLPSVSATSGCLPPNVKDSRWLTLEVCRQYQRNQCSRDENECKFAHPPTHVDVQNGRVVCCYDSIKVIFWNDFF